VEPGADHRAGGGQRHRRLLTTLSAVDSLALARERFYAQGRFADVFAASSARPTLLADAARAARRGRRADHGGAVVRISCPASDPIIGQLIGIDPQRPPR
jgi:putative ABC transport system permease protein